MPINNFIVATEPLSEDLANQLLSKDVAVADDKFVVNYWRKSHDNRMIYGGGENYSYQFPKDIKATVLRHMLEMYPDLDGVPIDYAWGGTLGITMNRMPCFAQLAPNVLSASGYSGHGVGMATMAGRIMAEAIAGNAEEFDVMASIPTHKFPGGGRLRFPLMVLAMTWFSLRDRLGL
jgi:gamma-glutamylputrescine oxidase